MARSVNPTRTSDGNFTTDAYWDRVAGEVLALALPSTIKSIAFATTGSGSGATMTITLT